MGRGYRAKCDESGWSFPQALYAARRESQRLRTELRSELAAADRADRAGIRLPLAPLLEHDGYPSLSELARRLKAHRRNVQRAAAHGLTANLASEWADRRKLHAFDVWGDAYLAAVLGRRAFAELAGRDPAELELELAAALVDEADVA